MKHRYIDENTDSRYEFNSFFKIFEVDYDDYLLVCYVLPKDYLLKIDDFYEKKNIDYWCDFFCKVDDQLNEDLNYSDFKLKEKYISNYEMRNFFLEKGIMRKKKFLESESSYDDFFYSIKKDNKKLYFLEKAKKAYANEKVVIKKPDIRNDVNDQSIIQGLEKDLKIEIAGLSIIKKEYYNKAIDVQFSFFVMLLFSLWYIKFPKKMNWWSILGLNSAEDPNAHKYINNIDYMKNIIAKCNWGKEINYLVDVFKRSAKNIRPNLNFNIVNSDNIESLDFIIKSDIDNKLDSVYKIVNTYLIEISPNLSISYFSPISDDFKQSELKSRFDNARLVKTQFL